MVRGDAPSSWRCPARQPHSAVTRAAPPASTVAERNRGTTETSGLLILAASGAAFLAMKWVACASRGAADPMSSHDLEDLITAMAGRAEIVDEVRGAPKPV